MEDNSPLALFLSMAYHITDGRETLTRDVRTPILQQPNPYQLDNYIDDPDSKAIWDRLRTVVKDRLTDLNESFDSRLRYREL